MLIDKTLLDQLTAQAKASPRLRQHYDLRDSSDDESQRILNAIEPGTVIPIHRHTSSTLCLLSSGLYGIVFLKSGDVANATLAFSMAAALVPFIRRGTIRVIQRDSKGIPTIVTLS